MLSIALKEQRKRDLTALAVAIMIHLIIIGGILLSNFLFFSDLEEYRGPVLVKLGRADAPDVQTDTMPKAPESTEEEPASAVEEKPEVVEEVQKGIPRETVKTDESQNENAVERPISQEETGDRGDADTSSEKNTAESSTANDEGSPAEVEETVTVTKGSEEGNAFETTYESTPGLVGRNIWLPIYWYMPLPQYISTAIFEGIKSDEQLPDKPGKQTVKSKQNIFLQYYVLTGDEYYLKNPPDIEYRPQVWSVLEDGSYDVKNAEYKIGKTLRPVVLTFTVSTSEVNNAISDVKISRSSGYGELDDAVKYGFLKASFYNSTDIPVKGRFTYRFD